MTAFGRVPNAPDAATISKREKDRIIHNIYKNVSTSTFCSHNCVGLSPCQSLNAWIVEHCTIQMDQLAMDVVHCQNAWSQRKPQTMAPKSGAKAGSRRGPASQPQNFCGVSGQTRTVYGPTIS